MISIKTKSYKYSICFSGSGYHYAWQMGVGLYLQENYDLSECCFVGASAGSFVAILLAIGLPIDEYINKWTPESFIIFNLNTTGSYLITHDVLKLIHLKYMSQDDYKNANGRLYVSLTKCRCGGIRNSIVSEFESNEDVLNAICASSHIPYICTPRIYYRYRGDKCIDGSFTYNWVKLNDETLIVSPYRWSKKKYVYALTALFSNSEERFYQLVKQGYEDAKRNELYFQSIPKLKTS